MEKLAERVLGFIFLKNSCKLEIKIPIEKTMGVFYLIFHNIFLTLRGHLLII